MQDLEWYLTWRYNFQSERRKNRVVTITTQTEELLNPPPLPQLFAPKLPPPIKDMGDRGAWGLVGGLKSSGEVDRKFPVDAGLPVVKALTRRALVPWLLERHEWSLLRSLSPRLTVDREDGPVGEMQKPPFS